MGAQNVEKGTVININAQTVILMVVVPKNVWGIPPNVKSVVRVILKNWRHEFF